MTPTQDQPLQQSLIDGLMSPDAYSPQPGQVEFLQTHISLLFLTANRVYKVKKSVDLGFLDFTTLERRRQCCLDEVRLNRRLAPRVYLGVVPITRGPDGGLRVGGTGEALEWAVEMVRLPEAGMLVQRLEQGAIDNQTINAIADLLADFHSRCATGPGIDEHGSAAAVAQNVEGNLQCLAEFTEGHPGSGPRVLSSLQYRFLEERRRRYLEAQRDLFEQRVQTQRIREGHGDLHAGNLCIDDDGIVAYDCIEFSRHFRCGDVAADIAFLAMDLDYRGYPGFSQYFVRRYAQVAEDPAVRVLVDFYKGYRAVVRAKVAALTARAKGLSDAEREQHRRESMRYAQLACAYELPPAMVLMCGLPACGKSWLAKRLGGSLRAAILRSDIRRRVLAGLPARPGKTRLTSEYGRGAYAPELKDRTYRSLLGDALRGLRAGHSVVVDATFSTRQQRSRFVDAAARLELPYFVVHVTASEELTHRRLERRAQDASEPSDANLDVYEHARATFEPPTEVPSSHVIQVTSGVHPAEAGSSDVLDAMIRRFQGRERRTEP